MRDIEHNSTKWHNFFLSAYIMALITIIAPVVIVTLINRVFDRQFNDMGMAVLPLALGLILSTTIGVISSAVFAAGAMIYAIRFGVKGKYLGYALGYGVMAIAYWLLLFNGYIG